MTTARMMLAYVVYRAQNPLAATDCSQHSGNRRLKGPWQTGIHIIHKAIAFRRASDTSNDQGYIVDAALAAARVTRRAGSLSG
ncbi:MAG: hypothetical protein R3E31_06105 [Chloroflexota bacterium]